MVFISPDHKALAISGGGGATWPRGGRLTSHASTETSKVLCWSGSFVEWYAWCLRKALRHGGAGGHWTGGVLVG